MVIYIEYFKKTDTNCRIYVEELAKGVTHERLNWSSETVNLLNPLTPNDL
jgi:hypothetical protein